MGVVLSSLKKLKILTVCSTCPQLLVYWFSPTTPPRPRQWFCPPVARSRRSYTKDWRSAGSELNCTPGKQGAGDESEGTLVKQSLITKGCSGILDPSIPSYWSIMTPCVNTLAEGERHLLSNHANIEATNYNAIKHFLYVESFRDEQKICLNLVRLGQEIFAILPTGSGLETLIF